MSDEARGHALIAAGTVCVSTIPVFAKVLLRTLSSSTFAVLWMACSLGYTVVLMVFRNPGDVLRGIRAAWRPVVLTGAFAAVWVYLYFAGLDLLDPTVGTLVFKACRSSNPEPQTSVRQAPDPASCRYGPIAPSD